VSPTTPPGWLVEQLPVGMLEDDFLIRFTSIFQDVADTLVDSVDAIDASADLSLAPEPFVRWLGSWIAAYPHPGEAAQGPGDYRERAWIQAQARALIGRGTRPGLQLMLQELCGDRPVRVTDGGGVYPEGLCPPGDPAWVRVEMPAVDDVAATDVLDLIRADVPVDVAVQLIVDGVAVEDPVAGGSGSGLDGGDGPDGRAGDLSRSARRLPGTAGRAGQPFRNCRACAERNRPGEAECWRCGSPLHRPPPAPEPEPEPEPLVFGSESDSDEPRIWPAVVLIVLAVLIMVTALTGVALVW
jgi:phage tail-like protein